MSTASKKIVVWSALIVIVLILLILNSTENNKKHIKNSSVNNIDSDTVNDTTEKKMTTSTKQPDIESESEKESEESTDIGDSPEVVAQLREKQAAFESWVSRQNMHNGELVTFTVDRRDAFKSSYDAITEYNNRRNSSFKDSNYIIKFKDESCIDTGGVKKEWLQLVMREAFDEQQNLFTKIQAGYVPTYSDSTIELDKYKFIGMLLGEIMIRRYTVEFPCARSVYLYLLGRELSIDDVIIMDFSYFERLQRIIEYHAILEYTFADAAGGYGNIHVSDADRNRKVTAQNVQEFVHLKMNIKYVKCIEQQLKAMRDGFIEIIQDDIFDLFLVEEVQLLIRGATRIDVADWQRKTVYQYSGDEYVRLEIWFWEIVRSFNKRNQMRLLQFWTGLSKPPYDGFGNVPGGPLKITVYGDAGRCPSAHVCFNTLVLRLYPSKKILRRKLKQAIQGCDDMQFS